MRNRSAFCPQVHQRLIVYNWGSQLFAMQPCFQRLVQCVLLLAHCVVLLPPCGLLFAQWSGFEPILVHFETPNPYVKTQMGNLPIILSAPHGGDLAIPNTQIRKGVGLATGGSGFVVVRDTGTVELTETIALAMEKKWGKKPYLVINQAHRKYVDPNRPPDIAFEDANAKPVYEAYHKALQNACRDVQKNFQKGLLLDIHGQGTAKDTLFRGTQDGKTVTLLRQRFGEGAHSGKSSLFGQLDAKGWKVHPIPLDGKEQAGFRGGFIVQTYGSHQGFGIDAMQLEFGNNFRLKENREKTAATLVEALGDYADRFLETQLPKQTPNPNQPKAGVSKMEGDKPP